MDQRGAEPGTEVVLDNRKLILGFLLLIVVCGAFFVIGFMEGKRQAVQARVDSGTTPATPSSGSSAPPVTEAKSPAGGSQAQATPERSVRDQLDWYKNVQRGSGEAPKAITPGEISSSSVPDAKKGPATKLETPAAPATKETSAPAGKTTYFVQAGAFRQRHEAEVRADDLKSKGFTSSIEAPKTADQFYLVKVGKFDSRAEAVAVSRKLQKAGFEAIIKKN